MHVLIFGASGYVGSSLVRELRAAGHEVSAFARDPAAVDRLSRSGCGALRGDLSDVAAWGAELRRYDAVVFTARIAFADEPAMLNALLGHLEGRDQAFVYLSGTGVMAIDTPDGQWVDETFAEHESFTPPPWIAQRVVIENDILSRSERGVRAMVVRPPHIWGHGGSTMIRAQFSGVRQVGAACYIGPGLNSYGGVHVDDLAELIRLALERGQPGAVYNAVSGEFNYRLLAQYVGEAAGCPTRSISIEEAKQIWGDWMGPVLFGMSSRPRAVRSRAELGWSPTRLDLMEDVSQGGYLDLSDDSRLNENARERLGLTSITA